MGRRRKKRKIICFVLLLILTVILLLLLMYRKAFYMTVRNLTAKKLPLDASTDWSGGESYLKVPYASDSESQYLDLYVPSDMENPELYVVVHGGGFIAGDSQTRQAQFMYRYFRDHGYACATVNYRLAQEAPFPAGLEDVKAAVRFLRSHAEEYGYSTDHVSIFGESAGGYLASMTALTNDEEFMSVEYIGQKEDEEKGEAASAKVDVLVDYNGVVEFSGLSGQNSDWETLGVPPLVFKIANSWMNPKEMEGFNDCESYWLRQNVKEMSDEELQKVCVPMYIDENLSASEGPAVLIIHGDCDITVPILQSKRFYEKASAAAGPEKVEFWTIPDQGHAADMLYDDSILARVDRFIQEH